MGQGRNWQWHSLLLYVYLKRAAQNINSSVAFVSAFPQIPRTLPLQVFFAVTFDVFACILCWSHTSGSLSCGVVLVTDRWEYPWCVPPELGNCTMPACVAMQGAFHVTFPTHSFPGLSPWGPSSLLLKKQLVAQCEQLRSNQHSSHLTAIVTPAKSAHMKKWGPKVTMSNVLESPVWKIFFFLNSSELAFSMGDWRISRQTCQHPPAALWIDAQSCQRL